ncbi:MAG TPA: hypothetical protein VGB83_11610 [Actinomycetota bacterium]
MYGTVGKFTVKPDRVEEFLALQDEWTETMKPRLPKGGAMMMYRLDSDPTVFFVAAAAPDKEAYFTLADDPEQDKWFRRVHECLASEPEWNDGEVVRHDFD